MKTSRMFGFVAAAALALAATACKKEEASPEPKVQATKKVEPAKVAPPAPVALTVEQKAKVYQDCWAAFNTRDWAKLEGCYQDGVQVQLPSGQTVVGKAGALALPKAFAAAFPDLVGEAQYVLVSGNHIASLTLLKGTHTSPLALPGMPEVAPTNKRIGIMTVHAAEVNDQGKALREWHYYDSGAMMSQLGLSPMPARAAMEKGIVDAPKIVIAKDDEAERAHVAQYNKGTEAFNKRDAAAVSADFAPDAVWSESGAPKDMTPKEMVTGLEMFWKSFSDIKSTTTDTWAAGDFTVALGMITGTNDGDMPMMKMKKTGKQISVPFVEVYQWEGNKVKAAWLVYDGGTFAAQLGLIPPKPAEKKAKGG